MQRGNEATNLITTLAILCGMVVIVIADEALQGRAALLGVFFGLALIVSSLSLNFVLSRLNTAPAVVYHRITGTLLGNRDNVVVNRPRYPQEKLSSLDPAA